MAGPLGLDVFDQRGRVLELTRTAGMALFAEASSQLRLAGAARRGLVCADAFDRWIERAPADARPDVVLELGLTPTSAGWARWLEREGPAARFVLPGTRFRDPSGRADAVVLGDPMLCLEGLAARLGPRPIDEAFSGALAAEEARVWTATERALTETPGALHEGTVTRALAAALAAGGLLSLGNSLPIRHADRFVQGEVDLRVLTQRGVNGIDGTLAGAAGAATASGAPLAVLLGDVTLAHDVGSLALCARVRSPLLVVVLDNGGGRIFDQLPIGRADLSEPERALFATPPALDFGPPRRPSVCATPRQAIRLRFELR